MLDQTRLEQRIGRGMLRHAFGNALDSFRLPLRQHLFTGVGNNEFLVLFVPLVGCGRNHVISGEQVGFLNIVDDFTKQCLAIESDTSLPGRCVVNVLHRLAETSSLRKAVTVDNGPEFASKTLDEWTYAKGLHLNFIQLGNGRQKFSLRQLVRFL